jgi:uncharacterized protein YndB with AHSA1/START domain
MKPVVHGSFTIERTYRAPPARVFAAWADGETKARWFMGPPETWTLVERTLDLRVGGQELLRGRFASGATTTFEARYHDIVPNRRLVFAYDMYAGDQLQNPQRVPNLPRGARANKFATRPREHLSASLATVELAGAGEGATRMTFTEQAAFLDGEDGTRSREAGTAAHFDRLAGVLEDRRQIVSTRVFEAPPARVYRAFADPAELALWWGPAGSRNAFETFDLRPGGAWRFVMRGPDGAEYRMDKAFVEVLPGERVVLQHRQAGHDFRMTMAFVALETGRTQLTWRMRFEAPESVETMAFLAEANEQNFDRLAAHLAERT